MRTQFKVRKWITIGVLLVAVAVSLYWNGWLFQNCNIASISLRGDIHTYLPPDFYNESGALTHNAVASKDILDSISEARDDDNIDAVLVFVDSAGGSGVAAEAISEAIKQVGKPVIAIVGDGAFSAAYQAISSASSIIASEYSEIGGLGVTMSYLENVEKNKKEGLSYIELNTAKYKEIGSPDKPLSWEERQMLQKQLDKYHNIMVRDIADNRQLSPETIKLISDGRYFTGVEAKELGLIDNTGTYFDALRLLENKIGKKAEVCK